MLHLHCKGIAEIANLDEYTGLKAIYLESNSVEELDGLLHLSMLRCLYMSKNCLYGLDGVVRLTALTTLDVSENQIASLEGLRGHRGLTTLVAYGNKLKDVDDIDALRECPMLGTLDLSKNKLADRACVDFLIQALGPRLGLLKLQGNPVVSEVPSYRKTLVVGFESLNYLDDMPVFPRDRRLANAWARGGIEEEKAERARCFADEAAEREKHREQFNEMVRSARAEAEARRANGTVPDPELRYRFMSNEARAEAKMLYEEGVPEHKLDEMREKGQLPWQVEAAAAAAEARSRGPTKNVAKMTRIEQIAAETDDDAPPPMSTSQKENDGASANARSVAVSDEDAAAPVPVLVAAVCDASFDAGDDVPVAILADTDDAPVESAPPESAPPAAPPPPTGFEPGTRPGGVSRELLAYDPSTHAVARRAARARALERHAAATDAAGAGVGGRDVATRSPVVYGTRAYGGLWERAMALGEIQAAHPSVEEKEEEGEESGGDVEGAGRMAAGETGRSVRTEETEEEGDEDDAEVDDTVDLYERYAVSDTSAGPVRPASPSPRESPASTREAPTPSAAAAWEEEEHDLYDLD